MNYNAWQEELIRLNKKVKKLGALLISMGYQCEVQGFLADFIDSTAKLSNYITQLEDSQNPSKEKEGE